MTDLIGGQIDLMCDQTTNTTSQIDAKKVKAFAVTTSKRVATPVLKDLPTLQESGLKTFEVTIWHGLYAPKGTPRAVLDKVNAALKVAGQAFERCVPPGEEVRHRRSTRDHVDPAVLDHRRGGTACVRDRRHEEGVLPPGALSLPSRRRREG